jgi:hypothetical protein
MNLTSTILKRQTRLPFSITAVAAAGALLVGCQNPEATRILSTLTGLAGGAFIGKYFGGRDGAFIGGALGGALGLAAVQIIYKNQMDLETRRKALDASIDDAKVVLDQSRAYNTKLQKTIQAVQAQLDRISADFSDNKITARQAKELKAALVPALDTLYVEARQTGMTIEDYAKKVESSDRKAPISKEIEGLNAEIAKLQKILQTAAVQRIAAEGL